MTSSVVLGQVLRPWPRAARGDCSLFLPSDPR